MYILSCNVSTPVSEAFCVLTCWIFSFLACLLEVDQEVWHSTELKDHSCTVFGCLLLQTECRLGRLLSWKFQETWLDAPASPQVSGYFPQVKFLGIRLCKLHLGWLLCYKYFLTWQRGLFGWTCFLLYVQVKMIFNSLLYIIVSVMSLTFIFCVLYISHGFTWSTLLE